MLTDNGICFTPAFARACVALGAEYRHTRPYMPQTNDMVERFNGRVSSEVLGMPIYSHRDLEQLLRGFNAAYNDWRQRVLDGKTPNQVVAECLKARRRLARCKPRGRARPGDVAKARSIVEAAKEVSQSDNTVDAEPCVFLAELYRSEQVIAGRLRVLALVPSQAAALRRTPATRPLAGQPSAWP